MDNIKLTEENFFKNLTPEKAQTEINILLAMKDCHPEYNYYFKQKGNI